VARSNKDRRPDCLVTFWRLLVSTLFWPNKLHLLSLHFHCRRQYIRVYSNLPVKWLRPGVQKSQTRGRGGDYIRTLAPEVCRSSVWRLLYTILLGPKDFWNICATLIQRIHDGEGLRSRRDTIRHFWQRFLTTFDSRTSKTKVSFSITDTFSIPYGTNIAKTKVSCSKWMFSDVQ